MLRSLLLLALCLVLGYSLSNAQTWVSQLQDRSVNFYDVQRSFNQEWGNKPYVRGKGWKQYKRWENFWEPRVYPHGIRPPERFVWNQHLEFQQQYSTRPSIAKNTQARWSPMGPTSWVNASHNPGLGRINTIVEDPNDQNTIYVGAPAGGCWKSTDAGATWQVLTDELQSLGVSAIAIDYTDSDIIYLGTGDDDGGDTYSIGLIKSTDGGTTWQDISPQTVSLFGTRMYRIIIHPNDHNTLLVATSNGCFRSTDAGRNWTRLRSGQWKDMELHPDNPDIIYLSNKSFVRSTDGGATWQTITTGLPLISDINRAEIAVTEADSSYVYLVCGNLTNNGLYGVYRSTNEGQSFTLQANTPNILGYEMQGTDNGGQSWYDLAIAVSPTNANEVYIGGINVWKSIDGGISWFIRTHWVYPSIRAYTHADIHCLDFYDNRLYCGSDGGAFVSTNGGNRFNDLSSGLTITQFYRIGGTPLAPKKIVGGTQDNGCNLIENNVSLHIAGGDGMEAWISNTDTNLIYTASQFGGFRRSRDGGYNSDPIFPSARGTGSWVAPLAMHPVDNSILLAGFDQVHLSYDGGSSSTAVTSIAWGGKVKHLAISPAQPYTHFYAASDHKIYKTQDGSLSWTNITQGLPSNAVISRIALHPTDEDKLWVTLSGFLAGEKVYTSNDGGQTWVNISRNLPNIPVNCLISPPNTHNALYIGTDLGVYYTDSIIAQWQPYMEGLPNVIVNDFDISNNEGKLRAGTHGRGIWEVDLRPALSTPPVADFDYDSEGICLLDSVTFNDRSIDNAPYWEWFFPGGSPSSSTLANPKINYAAAGLYQATLVVRNPFGYDTVTQVVAVDYSPNATRLDIQTDNQAIDVSWILLDNNGNTVTESPAFAYGNRNNQLIQESICLNAGCYKLIMRDFSSNGLCCGNGNGYYLLTNTRGDTLGMGSQYGAMDTVDFCVNQTRPLQIGASTQAISCGQTDGSINAVSIGGLGDVEYSLDNGPFQSSPVFGGLSGGLYQLVGRDTSGATDTAMVQLNAPSLPIAVATASTNQVFLNQGGVVDFFSTNSTNGQQFSWTFPDGSTSTQADPSYTFTGNSGTYPVILTVASDGCTDSDTLMMQVTNNISVDRVETAALLEVMPNPVQQKASVNWSIPGAVNNITLIIHNANGQCVYWQEFAAGTQQATIHLGNQPAGVYTVTLLAKGTALSRKLIKQ